EPQWLRAVRIHPKSHVVEWHCEACGRGARYPAGAFDVDLEGGSDCPDVLGCGAYPLLIVSERVVSAWRGAGVTSCIEHPVGISAVHGANLRFQEYNYCRIELTGECMIDFAAMGMQIRKACGRCGESTKEPLVCREFKILEGSWDGSYLFGDH